MVLRRWLKNGSQISRSFIATSPLPLSSTRSLCLILTTSCRYPNYKEIPNIPEIKYSLIFKIPISGVAPTIWGDFAGKHLAGIQHVSNTAGENTKRFKTKIHKIQKFAYLPPLVLCGRNLLPAWHPSLQVRTSVLHHVMDSRRKRIILCLCHVVLFFMFVPKTHIVCLLSKSTIWAPKEWYLMKNISEAGSKLFTYFSPSSLHSGFLFSIFWIFYTLCWAIFRKK